MTGDSSLVIDDSRIQSNNAPGLLVSGDEAFIRVSRSSIVNNSGDGVRNTGAATVILTGDVDTGNAIHDNQGYGVNQSGTNGQTFAAYAWWGDPSGPSHSGNPGGAGEEVTDRVLYDPWHTEPPTPPSVATQLVQTFGTLNISPGDTTILGVYFNNILTQTLNNTIILARLPDEAEYLMSIGGGQYWPQRHEVVWQLNDAAPGTTKRMAVQVHFAWGLAPHTIMNFTALIAAENRPSAWITLGEYQAYSEIRVASSQEVSEAQLAAILASDPDLNALYQGAMDAGFLYYGSAQMEQLSDGSERLALVMMDTTKPGERIDLYQDVEAAVAVHTTPQFEEIYNLTGGFRFLYETGEVDSWGSMQSELFARFSVGAPCGIAGCDDFGYNDCLRNCMIDNIPAGQFASHYSSKCATCYSSGEQCQQCAWHMYLLRNDTIKTSLDFCYDVCDENPEDGKCTGSTRECTSSKAYMVTPCIDCEYQPDYNTWGTCASDQRCINGFCVPIDDPDVDDHQLETIMAADPNEMYGPTAVAPGQWITYTIAYENVGLGNAYGVYILSQLPEELDAGNLDITAGGIFLPGSRTLLWDVGMLGPGAGGQVHFSARVSAQAPVGSVMLAGATVYFPSVPETTPTNPVVTLVQEVTANRQLVETGEGVPLQITLSGYSPSGNPLVYTITRDPQNGTLSGVAPHLTYTPAANFEGFDSFNFVVGDGVDTSQPE